MAFSYICSSFILVVVIMFSSLDNTSSMPTTLHDNLKDPCRTNGKDHGTKGEIDELAVWKSMRFLAHDIRNSVKLIKEHQDHLPCENTPSFSIHTLNKLNDFSQIKDLRTASKAAYSDLINVVAHFNIIADVQECWNESVESQISKLRNNILPVLCSINGILEADAEVLLKDVIALKILANNQNCSHHSTVTCTLLDHVQDLANALVKYNVPSS